MTPFRIADDIRFKMTHPASTASMSSKAIAAFSKKVSKDSAVMVTKR
jgi:hypothetical protein